MSNILEKAHEVLSSLQPNKEDKTTKVDTVDFLCTSENAQTLIAGRIIGWHHNIYVRKVVTISSEVPNLLIAKVRYENCSHELMVFSVEEDLKAPDPLTDQVTGISSLIRKHNLRQKITISSRGNVLFVTPESGTVPHSVLVQTARLVDVGVFETQKVFADNSMGFLVNLFAGAGLTMAEVKLALFEDLNRFSGLSDIIVEIKN